MSKTKSDRAFEQLAASPLPMVSLRSAANLARCSQSTIQRAIEDGVIPALTFTSAGRTSYVIRESDAVSFEAPRPGPRSSG